MTDRNMRFEGRVIVITGAGSGIGRTAALAFAREGGSVVIGDVNEADGAETARHILESGGFAAVVPVTEEGEVVLVRQWRQPLGTFTLELPSGAVDAGEDPAEAAGRELLEETGFRAAGLARLASVHTSTGRTTEVCHLFRCRAVRALGGPRPEPTEFIEVVEMPLGEAIGKVVDGGITDAATVLGLLWAAGGGVVGDGGLDFGS